MCTLDDSEKNYVESTSISDNEESLTEIFKISDNFTNLVFHPLQRCLPVYKYADKKTIAVEKAWIVTNIIMFLYNRKFIF